MAAFQYNVLMRIGQLEASLKEVLEAVDQLGRRIEPEDSVFHFQKMKTMNEFKEFDGKLDDAEYYNLTVLL